MIFPGSMKKIDLEVLANVESVSQLVKVGYRVHFDSKREDAFHRYGDGQRWKFRENQGIYTLMPDMPHSHQWEKDITHMEASKLLWETRL